MVEPIGDKKIHTIGKGLVDGFKENKWGSQFAEFSPYGGWYIQNISGKDSVKEYLEAEGMTDDNRGELVNRLQAHGYIVERETDSGGHIPGN